MTREQGQTQDAQNAQQSEYPANAGSGDNETLKGASGDDTQIDQLDGSWRPSDDPAIEQAGGTIRSNEEEPGRSQQDGKAYGAGEETAEIHGQRAAGGNS